MAPFDSTDTHLVDFNAAPQTGIACHIDVETLGAKRKLHARQEADALRAIKGAKTRQIANSLLAKIEARQKARNFHRRRFGALKSSSSFNRRNQFDVVLMRLTMVAATLSLAFGIVNPPSSRLDTMKLGNCNISLAAAIGIVDFSTPPATTTTTTKIDRRRRLAIFDNLRPKQFIVGFRDRVAPKLIDGIAAMVNEHVHRVTVRNEFELF